ncbi:MAG: hypothetical protein RIQ33_862 [Bacteroidota bacterium]|jgi:hypothetical protein
MSNINGIQVMSTTKVIIDFEKLYEASPSIAEQIEDLLDIVEAEQSLHEPTIPWETVKKKLDKKHGIKK